MPKVVKKHCKFRREPMYSRVEGSHSEPAIKNRADRDLQITNLSQRSQLQQELDQLKKELEDATKMKCEVCYSKILKADAVYMGDCGHGACRSCFVQSVAHSAVQMWQHEHQNLVHEEWRCFTCRESSVSYTEYVRGVPVQRMVSSHLPLTRDIRKEFTKIRRSLRQASEQAPGAEEVLSDEDEDFEEDNDFGEEQLNDTLEALILQAEAEILVGHVESDFEMIVNALYPAGGALHASVHQQTEAAEDEETGESDA